MNISLSIPGYSDHCGVSTPVVPNRPPSPCPPPSGPWVLPTWPPSQHLSCGCRRWRPGWCGRWWRPTSPADHSTHSSTRVDTSRRSAYLLPTSVVHSVRRSSVVFRSGLVSLLVRAGARRWRLRRIPRSRFPRELDSKPVSNRCVRIRDLSVVMLLWRANYKSIVSWKWITTSVHASIEYESGISFEAVAPFQRQWNTETTWCPCRVLPRGVQTTH